MGKTIVITGATGKVGKAVTSLLLNNGLLVRAIGRNSHKLNQLKKMGAEVFTGDLSDTEFLTNVFRGSDGLLAIAPDNFNETDFKGYKTKLASNIVSSAAESGIKYIIAISSIGAGLDSVGPVEPLFAMEQQLKELKDFNVIVLRPAFYMENLLTSIPLIRNAGINGAAFVPDVYLPMVSIDDVAKIAAEHLTLLNFSRFKVKEVLGPRDYTMQKVTSILGQVIGKPQLKYIQFTPDQVRKSLSEVGFSQSGIDALIESIEAHNNRRIQASVKRSKENTTMKTFDEFASQIFAKIYNSQYKLDVVT